MNLYQIAYDLLNQYIYGGGVVEGTYEDLACIMVATYFCLYMIALPFRVCGFVNPLKLFRGDY